MKNLSLILLSCALTFNAACVDEEYDEDSDELVDGKADGSTLPAKKLSILESSPETGILRSKIVGGFAETSLEKTAGAILSVSGWSEIKGGEDNDYKIFASTKIVRDDKVSLAKVGNKRTIKAKVFANSSYGQIEIPVNVTATRTSSAITIHLENEKATKLFTTVLDDGGIKLDITLKPLGEGVTVKGTFAVELLAGQENAPSMELLSPLYNWAQAKLAPTD